MISGSPQGSVLGPVLFILYVNDLPEVVQSKLWIFAEDTKSYRSISFNERCYVTAEWLKQYYDMVLNLVDGFKL